MQKTNVVSRLLKAHIIKEAKNNQRKFAGWKKKNFTPSSDLTCIRQTYFNFLFSGKDLPELYNDVEYGRERAKMQGNVFHDFLEENLRKMGILKLHEYTLYDKERKFKGRIDFIVEIKNELFLIEAKSAKSYSIKIMNDEASASTDHQKQIQSYFYLIDLNKDDPEIQRVLNGRELNKGIIFYENKNTHEPLEFGVYKNPEIIKDILHFIDETTKYIDKEEEPQQRLPPDSPECLYKCSKYYYGLCHGQQIPDEYEENDEVWGTTMGKSVKKVV